DEDEEFPDGEAQVEAEHAIEDVEGHHDFEQPHLNDNPPRVVEQPGLDIPPAEDNWRDLDRLGDELTWQRLLGLDGSLVFLERVVWVISLDTLFTIMFAYAPYKLGFYILTKCGVMQSIHYFPSIAAILAGYVAVTAIIYVLHYVVGIIRLARFDVQVYVFYFASFVLLLREVLRPGVLWFMRNLNDPEFNPIQEMIELPVTRHLRRLVASTDNLVSKVVLPALLEQTQARFLLKTIVMWWCVHVGGALSLDSISVVDHVLVRYLLPDLPNPEHQHDGAGAGAGAQGVGGLAAEHQKLFSASLSSRASSFAASPTSSVFIHWMIGMVYVFYFASFVLLLREVLRPGVLWFMRNLNDPEFNPIQEMIELPVTRHLRRLVASTSLCFTTIFLIVYLPLVIVQKLYSSLLPYNMSLSADTPLSELSLELLILQVVLPALLEQTQARFLLKTIVMWWCVHVGGALSLDRYLLPDLPNPEHQHDGAGAGAGAQGVGGLAAEHQALLLLREPQAFQPYIRPRFFPLRVLVLLGTMAVTCCFASCLLFLVPVVVGRTIIHNLTGYSNVHELYTVGTGLYVCWMSVKMGLLTLHWFHLGLNHLKEAFVNSIYLIYQDGIRNLRARFILTQLIIPVILFLSSLLAFPYLIARLYIFLIGAPLEESVLVLRYCFPSSLIILLVVSFLRWQLNKIQGLAENIRNEKLVILFRNEKLRMI
ncbi:unnamed protein product, partial [Strongylus vulgaris]